MTDTLFATLSAKTFILLSGVLLVCYATAHATIIYFQRAARAGALFVSTTKTKEGEVDLEIDAGIFHKLFWPSLGLNIIAFLFLFFANSLTVRVIAFLFFALTDGVTIGLVLLAGNEHLGRRVLLLTALATVVAGSIGYFSNLNIAWIGTYLFFALLALIAIMFVRIFIKITGWKRRLIASFGILIFIGYLLYDFSALKAAKGVQALNTWATAIDFSLNIYLDIINLFLELLDLLSGD